MAARSTRSVPTMYCCLRNSCSSLSSCSGLKTVRILFILQGPPDLQGTGGPREPVPTQRDSSRPVSKGQVSIKGWQKQPDPKRSLLVHAQDSTLIAQLADSAVSPPPLSHQALRPPGTAGLQAQPSQGWRGSRQPLPADTTRKGLQDKRRDLGCVASSRV